MKKLLAIILTAVLALALSACAENMGDNADINSGNGLSNVGNAASDISGGGSVSDASGGSVASDQSGALISRDEAINKALEKAGVKRADVRDLEAELDREQGGIFWEVSFEEGDLEYSYDINAETGEIVKVEREIED